MLTPDIIGDRFERFVIRVLAWFYREPTDTPDRSDSNINKNTSRSFSKGEGGGCHGEKVHD